MDSVSRNAQDVKTMLNVTNIFLMLDMDTDFGVKEKSDVSQL